MQVDGFAEPAERQSGLTDGVQALAPYVADQHAGPGVVADRRVQVAADLGLLLRGQVEGRRSQRAEPVRQRPLFRRTAASPFQLTRARE